VARAPSALSVVAAAPLVALAAVNVRVRRPALQAMIAGAVLIVGFAAVLTRVRIDGPGGVAGSENHDPGPVYRLIVDSAMGLPPIVAAAVAALLVSNSRQTATRLRGPAFTAVAVASLCGLIGFPFLNDVYFFYTVPLLLAALVAVPALWNRPLSPWIGAAAIATYGFFGIVHLDARDSALLLIARSGGLRVPPADSVEVVAFVDTLRAHSRNGYTYATPDCPEAYFLSGLKNPTPTMYEIFDDTAGRTDRILALLDARHITAVAVNRWTIFSGRPDPRLLAALRERYPDSAAVWHFIVRWRAGSAPLAATGAQ